MTDDIDQFRQIVKGPVWDGNLIGKSNRDELVKNGLVARTMGWNFLTKEGMEVAVKLKIVKS